MSPKKGNGNALGEWTPLRQFGNSIEWVSHYTFGLKAIITIP